MKRPGQWLRLIAARLCTKRTMERVIDPVVADVQTEYEEAVRWRSWWRPSWVCIRGYSAFWTAVSLNTLQSGPRSLWNGITDGEATLARLLSYWVLAFVGLTLLLAASPMIDLYSRTQFGLQLTLLLLPQAIPLSIPVALPLAIACGMRGARMGARRIRVVLILAFVGMLWAFTAMLLVPLANQAFRVALAEELGVRGVTEYSLPRGANELSLSELASRSQDFETAGSLDAARQFKRAYHIRFALPVATVVLSLLALGLCGTLEGRIRRVVAVIISVGLYWAILALGVRNTSLPPVVSVWAPNVLFMSIALVFLTSPAIAAVQGPPRKR